MRISKLKLGAGPAPDRSPLEVETGAVTVFLGPNGGGKSTALREIESFAHHRAEPPRPWRGEKVVRSVEIDFPQNRSALMSLLEPRISDEDEHGINLRSFSPQSGMPGAPGIQRVERRWIDYIDSSPETTAPYILGHYTIALNGRQRFELAASQQASRLDEEPSNHWMAIERDVEAFMSLDARISSALGKHLVIQTMVPTILQPALSTEKFDPSLLQSTSPEALARQSDATPLTECSDGEQVFCGLLAAVTALPHQIIIVDEPEAYLHPTLARRLASELSRIAADRDASLIVATHSADFLFGCIDEVPETAVIRVNYTDGVPTAHQLSSSEVAELSRDPLLRSADTLKGLFTRSAVVCEADSDRAFYEEVNRRLLGSPGFSGIQDCAFLNAQNWQTIPRIAGPLRRAGVAAAVILDLDTLGSDDVWSEIVALGESNPSEANDLAAIRAEATQAIQAAGKWNDVLKVKVEGMKALTADQTETVQRAIDAFARIGVFLVPVGELEMWLPQLGCTNKQTWVTDILEKMGDRDSALYAVPTNSDVWEFIEKVSYWTAES